MVKGLQDNVLLVGNLKSVRVVLDVRDIVNAYYLLMLTEKSDGQIYNVSGDTPHEMGVYTDILIKLSGLQNVEKQISDKLYRPIDIHYQHGDCNGLIELTGWKPDYQLEQTLKDLLDYWLKKLG